MRLFILSLVVLAGLGAAGAVAVHVLAPPAFADGDGNGGGHKSVILRTCANRHSLLPCL
jgi:hypothetical protein